MGAHRHHAREVDETGNVAAYQRRQDTAVLLLSRAIRRGTVGEESARILERRGE